MKRLAFAFYLKIQAVREEHGQDMIEYVLIGGIVALGAVAGMSSFATSVNSAFSNLGTLLGSYT